jgi:hypothetical protein
LADTCVIRDDAARSRMRFGRVKHVGMNRHVLLALAVPVLVQTGCGAERLTPERIRTLLDAPTGDVTPDTMTLATRDLFQADRATSIENFAQVLKVAQSAEDGAIIEDGKDVFCAAGIATDIATFDACAPGANCKSELTFDSCLLRLGDEGDEDARGRIKFGIENSVDADAARSNLSLAFEGWESTRDDTMLDALDGVISLETSQATDLSSVDLVFLSDLDVKGKRKTRGFLDDGIEEQVNVSVGVRFQAQETVESQSGSLEVLAFVDENGEREQSVTIRMAAESHLVDAESATASASIEVVGSNGSFACNWSAAEEAVAADGSHVSASGECIDENGDSFTFTGEAIAD